MTIKPGKPGEKDLPGYVINDPQYGSVFIGEDESAKRTRQIEVHSQSGAHLKLFKDGGFELHGQPCDTADNINSNAAHGLNIKSSGKNLRIDAGNGTLTLAARIIRFESSASDETLVIRSSNNIAIEANDTVRISAANIILGARNKLLLGSKGPTYIKGNGGVTIIEPRSTLLPTNLGQLVEKLFTAAVFGEI
jgi:uncharacterized protein (DUF2345 family)